MTTKAIVITTINSPTAGIRKIAQLCQGWSIIVVGDKKTPADWKCAGTDFLAFASQCAMPGRFPVLCPPNHYARKNIGYLAAIRLGAKVLAETDDDNLPYDSFLGTVDRRVPARLIEKKGWENVYRHFTDARIWPRGLPLQEINSSFRDKSVLGPEGVYDCPVQQFLADGDPDVDAVYRLTTEGDIKFKPGDIVMGTETYCPFNSQNTIWWPEVYPLLYLPSHVSFRMTDIWRSFVAQICLYKARMKLAFRSATVVQVRNEHNLLRDFSDEVPGYLHNDKIMNLLGRLELSPDRVNIGKNLLKCYEELVRGRFVPEVELPLVSAWLDDLSEIARAR
ncbi:MAG TPA: STELLO glycosyltransferase family protein [Verrucomicrobiae bacterium]